MEEITYEANWPERALQRLTEAKKSKTRAEALLTEMQTKLERDGCPEELLPQIAAAMDQLKACVELSDFQIREAAKEIAGFDGKVGEA